MAGELVEAVGATIETDFAMLGAAQMGVERPDSLFLATSMPGAVGLVCGWKYATCAVRLERWTGRPAQRAESWEEWDEVPFEPLPDGGPLYLGGFEHPAPGVPGVDIAALGRSRVQVHVRGRYRASVAAAVNEEPPPEEWLLRVWPDQENLDAMAGEPRRLVGATPFRQLRSPWGAAIHQFHRAGWAWFLRGIPEFPQICGALARAAGPIQAADLAAAVSGEDGLDAPLVELAVGRPVTDRAELVAAAGVPALHTLGDFLDVLLRLGVLARPFRGGDWLVPNPGVPPPSEVLDLPADQLSQLRIQGLQADFRAIQWDLLHLLRWAPEQVLRVTLYDIAVRLGVLPDEVRGGIEFLQAQGHISTELGVESIGPFDRLEIRRPR